MGLQFVQVPEGILGEGGGRVPEQGILRLELRLNRWISALQQYCSLHEAKGEIGLESTQQLRASE